MSVYIIEDAVQYAVDCIAASGADIQVKRGLIHTLYRLQEYGDCNFTNLRCTGSLQRCAYTFLFDKEEMWDYEENRDFYDRELPAKTMFSQGDLYLYHVLEENPALDGKVCVDSGSPAWASMVAAGRITGEGTKPLACPPTGEALLAVSRLIEAETGWDEYFLQGFRVLVVLAESCEAFGKKMSEGWFREALGCSRKEYLRGKFFV